jgi:hypothetical protein
MNTITVPDKIKKINSMVFATALFITVIDLFSRILKLQTYKNHLTSVLYGCETRSFTMKTQDTEGIYRMIQEERSIFWR